VRVATARGRVWHELCHHLNPTSSVMNETNAVSQDDSRSTDRAVPAAPGGSGASSGNLARVLLWIGVGLAFGVWVAVAHGSVAAAEYYAAYLLELSLSVDNMFVFVIVFAQLSIPPEYQHRVLGWGVAGALAFRALMIGAGITLIQRFHWITYPFAALILFAAWRMLFAEERQRRVVEGACNVCSTWIARLVRVSPVLDGDSFWGQAGRRATRRYAAVGGTCRDRDDRHCLCA
jgi:hypothetical protein